MAAFDRQNEPMRIARIALRENRYWAAVQGEPGQEVVIPLAGNVLNGQAEPIGDPRRLRDITLLPPVVPSKIVAVGRNYADHVAEMGYPVAERPKIFFKPPSSLITHGQPIGYPSEAVKEVLGRTLGVPIFQEQVMQLAMVAAGFTPGEADRLRRSMAAWKKRGGLEHFEGKLKQGMQRHGYSAAFADARMWSMRVDALLDPEFDAFISASLAARVVEGRAGKKTNGPQAA